MGTHSSVRPPREPYVIVRTLVALVLLGATVLKIQKLATAPTADDSLLTYRWSELAIALMQIGLSVWLLSGLWRRLAWVTALACFCAFSIYTTYLGLTGAASCGCFGRVEVNPWITLGLDVAIAIALMIFRPRPRERLPRRSWRPRLIVSAVVVALAGTVATVLAVSFEPANLLPDGRITGSGHTVVLEPDTWKGKRWGLLDHVDIGGRLASGKWTVMLYHHNCAVCQEMLSRQILVIGRPTRNIAFIEIPPYGSNSWPKLLSEGGHTVGRVGDDYDWFVPTPVVLTLSNGIVKDVQVGKGSAVPTTAPATQPVSEKVLTVTGTEATCDFGTVKTGSTHYVTFVVRSPADRPLEVRRVMSECECLSVAAPPKTITPAGTSIQVKFDAPKEAEPYTTRLVIVTRDREIRMISLRVKADVRSCSVTDEPMGAAGCVVTGCEDGCVAGGFLSAGMNVVSFRIRAPATALSNPLRMLSAPTIARFPTKTAGGFGTRTL